MHRHTRSDTGDISSPRSSRAPSFSSDRPSVAGSITFQMPSSVRPSPAYIAASVASQIVTDHHNARLREDMDSDHDDDAALLANALFSEQALCLLNAFLDHLLFAFLSTGRSPSLTAIRPAVAEVLKPRLAREAMEAADEELQGLLAGEDEDEFPVQDGKIIDKWDVEKVWKRTRLRIMVYTRLGELEDEDEERYVEQERGLSMDEDDSEDAGLVSWASAIFLTSVIEFIAEQTLLVSGQAAYARTAAKLKRLAQKSNDPDDQIPERIVVEEPDVEKIALNSALGRLWRTWRKRVRSPIQPLSPGRGLHYMSSYTSLNSLHRRRRSHDTADESILNDDVTEVPEHKPTETEIAANIPLPMGDNDVNEIEVPGLARTYEDAESSGTQTPIARPQRPSSFIMLAPAESFRRRSTKVRPVSMPPPATVPFEVPARSVGDEESQLEPHSEQHAEPETPFETPMERPSDDESYIHEEEQESIDLPKDQQTKSEPWREEPSKLPIVEEEQGKEEVVQNEDLADEQVDKGKLKEEAIDDELNADLVAFAASTGMGYRMSAISPVDSSFPRREDSHTLTPIPSAQSVQSYESETPEPPKVMQLKRMSIEKTGPPVVRTSSVRSTSSRTADRKPASTPEPAKEREGTSYLYDDVSEEDMPGPSAIGVAHTSNVPIRTSPSPSEDHVSTNGKAKQPAAAHGRYVEVQPRQTTTTSIAVRKAPVVEEKPTAPVVVDRSTQRKEVPRKEVASGSTSTSTRAESPLSAPRKRDVTPPKSRGTVLSSLQEADGWSEDQHQQQQPTLPEKSAQRGSPARGSPASNSPKTSVSYRNREAPAAVAERQYRQTSNEESTHSRSNTAEGSPEKATLQRVSSSSSTTRSTGTSILYTGRDSEASVNGRPRGLSGRMSEEDRERQFDTLVKGQETVKYTLTPQSMRDMDEPVVVKRVEPHKPISSVTVYPRVNADKDSSFGSSHLPAKTAVRHEGPTAQTNRASPSRKVLAKPLAREPRIQSESMRDFADFIRSTGPAPGEERPVQPFVALGGPKAKPANSTNGSLTSLTRKKSTKSGSSHSQTPSTGGEGPTLKPRVHMEPRSPGGQRSGNDDLIDFIRQGPPNSNNGQPRIPRSVAPFRTTVDSDQFDRMLDDNGNVESAYGSQVSTISKHSTQTSNSRTGLLPASNVVQPAYSNAPQKLSGSMASNAEPNIQRTRRRVKDPYAIDLSDDEDDDMLTALPSSPQPPAPQQPKQESLMDFLNGMEPPPTSKPEPFILSKETIAAARARANSGGISNIKTNSSPNLGMRNGASARSMQPGSNTSSIISDAPRAHKPRLQARVAGNARDSRSGRTATDDLADFLRNSGPIEPPAPSPATAARKEEGKRSNTRFWRKKTSTDA